MKNIFRQQIENFMRPGYGSEDVNKISFQYRKTKERKEYCKIRKIQSIFQMDALI